MFRHLGVLGLFFLAIVDSSPLPTLGGTDILVAILAATHRHPWWEYAAAGTAGSIIGAYLTFRVARKAGSAYMDKKFGARRFAKPLRIFHKWTTAVLAIFTAVPFPFPTGMTFAAAGAANYRAGKFLTIVTLCRAARYSAIALIAQHYGRRVIRMLRHPAEHWPWLLASAVVIALLVITGIAINRKLETATAPRAQARAET
jgi:membrane protein YqaA with SNARE-associated domain